jgi:hypothetical protein
MSQGMLPNEIRERILADQGYWYIEPKNQILKPMNPSSPQMAGPQPGYPAQSVGASVAAQTGEAVLSGERSFQTVQYLPTGDPETELMAVVTQFISNIPSHCHFAEHPRRIAAVLGYLTERYMHAAELQERQQKAFSQITSQPKELSTERMDELLRRMEAHYGLVDRTKTPPSAGTSPSHSGSFGCTGDMRSELEKLETLRDPDPRAKTATEVAEIERRKREYMLSTINKETIR